MMLYTITIRCLVVGLFSPLFLSAQNEKRDVLNPNQLKVEEFSLKAERKSPSEIRLPFSRIRIIDSRFDTSKIGYVLSDELFRGKRTVFEKMVLIGGSGNAIERYYNDYYAGSFSQNNFELLIVMKRFWFSAMSHSSSKRIETAIYLNEEDNLNCKWEYYIGKDGKYLPVKRIDTIIRNTEDLSRYIREEFSEKKMAFLKFTLKSMIEILDYSNAVRQFDNQPKKALGEIQEFNKRMNGIPVLHDSTFNKGVYLSFDDFKNNRPSIVDFVEKKMRYKIISTENYLENLKGEIISNYWGYSDGKEFRYGMLGNDKIFRVQNTFCFFIKVEGYIRISGIVDVYSYGGPDNNTKTSKKIEMWVPFQIDMETGLIY